MRGLVRWRWPIVLLLAGAAIIASIAGYREATSFPLTRHYEVMVPAWKLDRPLRIAFLSDTHAVYPDMPPERLRAIVAAVNALSPDLVLLGGDYVSVRLLRTGAVGTDAAVTPLGDLKAPLGVVAVLGNHDWKRDGVAVAAALKRHGIRVLRNNAVLLGPVAVMGTDDVVTERGNLGPAKNAMARLARKKGKAARIDRPVLLIAHSPAMAHFVPDYVDLTLAGHTHGGQVLPWLTGWIIDRHADGPLSHGHVQIKGHDVIVSAGIGASGLPIRWGVPPEIVLVTIRPDGGPTDQAATSNGWISPDR